MNEQYQSMPQNKDELITSIREARALLNERISPLTEEEMISTGSKDSWSVKDHLAHLVSWTEKLLAVLRGKPAYEGLKVDERTYLETSLDDMNALLHERNQSRSLEEVRVHFRQSHLELISVLEKLDESALSGPYLPTVPTDKRTLLEGIIDNSYGHDLEHLVWIEELLGSRGKSG